MYLGSEVVYEKQSYPIGYYTIDQTGTYSAPADMVRDRNVEGINTIRSASHLYVGELVNGILQCKQVSDTDKTLYADGTNVVLDGNKDLFMKLPKFWWKMEEVDSNSDIVKFSFCMSQKSGWNVWEGNEFIGVYQANVVSNLAYSRSGVTPASGVYWANFKNYARNRGNGYTLVTYEQHRMMAILMFGYIGTLNGRDIIGVGESDGLATTGQCDSLGMTDTSALNNGENSINYWGLEHWWGATGEWVDNLKYKRGTLSILNIQGNVVRTISLTNVLNTNDVEQMLWGENIDIIGKSYASSLNGTYYSTWFPRVTSSYDFYAQRGGDGQHVRTNASTLAFNYRNNVTASSQVTSRLCYKGDYEIVD